MEHQQQQQSTTVPQTPPAIRRPMIRLSSSLSPPPTPNGYDTPNRQRQAAWWQSSVVRRSSSAVDEAVDELTEKSKFLLRKKSSCLSTPRMSSSTTGSSSEQDAALVEEEEEDVPRIAGLDREEIMAGQLLGEGTFNCVYEVLGFDLHPADDDTGVRRELVQTSPTRFALKHLKPSLLDDTLQFEQAATDLVMEAKYMAALNHVNILKLHASPTQGTAAINSGFDGYFFFSFRLSETLAGRIDRWSQGQAQDTNTVLCKLSYALQIAEALHYLHQQRIVFRDLKPSNIGFAQQDTNRIQLFDFGLCRELPPKSQARPYVHGAQPSQLMDSSEYSLELDESWTEDDVQQQQDDDAMEQVYFMSGAGTQIYMAPEVLVQNRYNLKADVYSWAMTVTEMLLLEKPLEQYEMDDHIQYVCVEGDRPALEGHPEITESIRDLLAWAWEGDVSKRCTTQQLCQELPELIRQVEQEAPAKTVGAACSSNWYSRLWQAASRLQQYLVSVMGQALARVSSFLVGRSSSNSRRSSNTSRDVTFDLPQDDKEEPDASATQEELEEEPQDQSDQVLLSPRPTPRHSFSRSALLKRKPSSASTTAMTDDELDDDDLLGGISLSPSYSKPPMEALMERHNSNNSTNTTTTGGS